MTMNKGIQYSFLIFISLFLIFCTVYVLLALFIGKQAITDTKKKSDAILVLGARSYINGAYNPCLKARVEHAMLLYKEKYAGKLLMSGGNDKEDNVNEAETMKKMAIEMGVKDSDILLEKNATSTYENFTYSQKLFEKHGISSVIVVSEPFHMARASLIGKKIGMSFSVSPAVNSPCWTQNHYISKYFLKEPLAILGYKLQQKL